VLTAEPGPHAGSVLITCRDSGCGIADLSQVRTMFFTTKTDSHLKRGRMGRGFKEMLCLAQWASVTSGNQRILFLIEEGKRITRQETTPEPVIGTLVQMRMPWNKDVIAGLEVYFQAFAPPPQAHFEVNGCLIHPRDPRHRLDAALPTELLEQGRWIRPVRPATIELLPIRSGG